VSRYGVDLEAFERVALPALEAAGRADVVIIDELGKMELASKPFCDSVSELFNSRRVLVATVHLFRHPFTDALKARPDVERVRVTPTTREALAVELAERLSA
jgi:nucleoside-triphosphatase